MAVETPPTITPAPSPVLQRGDRAVFSSQVDAHLRWEIVAVGQFGAVASNVAHNAQEAVAAATTATTASGTATLAAGAAAASAEASAADRTQTGLDRAGAEASRIAASKLNLGGKTTAPAVDNQGAALLTGATYYDTTLNKWRVWSGAAWADGLSAVAGVASVNGATGPITLKTLNSLALTGAGDITLKTFNGIPLTGAGDIVLTAIRTPANVTPVDAATNASRSPTLTGSPYYSLYGVPMAGAQFQVSTAADFSALVVDTGDIAGTALTYVVSIVLSPTTTYYWRVRYKDIDGVYSAWSAARFTTRARDYIPTPAPTPASFGDPFEGGFYTGMIWNELMQSATSTLIGTGSKIFTVANMGVTPLVYAGQTLEVRSRANPANRMIGVVTDAFDTRLTLNITSVVGAGTFTDWSIMAQYRLIVAPKSGGESLGLAYASGSVPIPGACVTLSEGYRATMAMVAAGDASNFPAAWFCRNLNIAGKTDWYLPARDELELAWRNLKPNAFDNYVTADRLTASPHDYKTFGSYGDTANTHGLNNNSSPQGVAYTPAAPAQVAAGKNFRTGEAEMISGGNFAINWSASVYSTPSLVAWCQSWNPGTLGAQISYGAANTRGVRAMRRSII